MMGFLCNNHDDGKKGAVVFLWIKTNKFLLVSLSVIYLLAWVFQNHFLLNSDVSFLVHCSQRLLHGGNYGTDFLETNPPLILYLYVPCVWLMKYMPLAEALRVCIYLLASLSLLLSDISLKKLTHDHFTRAMLISVLAMVFLWLPLSEFGQREHLTILLVMPYFFLVMARLTEPCCNHRYADSLIGVMAALGLSLKPFFFVPYLFSELYYCLHKKTIFAYFRVENVAILMTVLLYAGWIITFHQAYLHVILPLIAPTYYSWYTESVGVILLLPTSIFIYSILLLYFMLSFTQPMKAISVVLLLATVGFWLSFVVQRTDWYYHELPHFAFGILLLVTLLMDLAKKPVLSRRLLAAIFLFSVLMGCCFYFRESYIYASGYPLYPYGFFGMMLCACVSVFLGVYHNKPWRIFLYSSVVLLLLVGFYHYLLHGVWCHRSAGLSIALFLLMMLYALPHENSQMLWRGMMTTVVGLFLFTYPCYQLSLVSNYASGFHQLYQQLIARMQVYQHRTTYYFTNTSEMPFPLIYYTQQQYVSRFWSFMWLPLMREPKAFDTYSQFYKKNQAKMDYFIQDIMTDFKKQAPDVVFVDDRVHSQQKYYGSVSPDYVKLFRQNAAFSAIWRHYKQVDRIDLPPLCAFTVYASQAFTK